MTAPSLEEKRKVAKEQEKLCSSYENSADGRLEHGTHLLEMPPGKPKCKWQFGLVVRK